MRVLFKCASLLVIAVAAILLVLYSQTFRKGVFKVYYSPNQQFRLIIYKYERIISSPGGGSDGPALLCLFDNLTGRELTCRKFQMILDEQCR